MRALEVITKGSMKVWPNPFPLMPAKVSLTCPPTHLQWCTHERDKDTKAYTPACGRQQEAILRFPRVADKRPRVNVGVSLRANVYIFASSYNDLMSRLRQRSTKCVCLRVCHIFCG